MIQTLASYSFRLFQRTNIHAIGITVSEGVPIFHEDSHRPKSFVFFDFFDFDNVITSNVLQFHSTKYYTIW